MYQGMFLIQICTMLKNNSLGRSFIKYVKMSSKQARKARLLLRIILLLVSPLRQWYRQCHQPVRRVINHSQAYSCLEA